ncbi:BACK domain-containing protein [Haematococcus lacustris]|uniref:BACK domain-containing protein n=1 Tax=Haematococcus lacustris TaxID=44745 RepID=A0A699ZRW1_HAELA|nr:BACK domain-containing protein [Haematococcus lacustris]
MELPLPWLCSDDTFADTVLQLCPGAVLAVHRSELSSHSQRLMAGPLRWEGSGSQGAADFLPSTAVAHFARNGSLPEGLTVSQLAQVCLEAERLAVPSLESSCLRASCLQKLADLPPSQLPAEQLVRVLQTLPDSCALLPEYQQWQQHVNSLILSQYGDVHAVITSAQLRGFFQQLPFAAVKQWAGSDALTVDSENSVVELISLWMAGSQGLACSEEQERQLSCLVRVQHLSPGAAAVLPGASAAPQPSVRPSMIAYTGVGAADFLPSSAVAHFAKDGSLPEGLTVSQLAQVCKEAKAQGDKGCAEACSQAIVNRTLEEAGSPQPPPPCLEETFDSQDECDAARLVVRCMYEGKLAEEVKDPLTLARVCRVAERWAFSSLSSSCLKQLADLPPSQLPAEQLVLVLQTLPDSCALLPEHQQWQERVHSLAGKLNALPLLLHLYGDVHAVITSAQLRTTFQQLPFAAVQQWAGSDALTVDSENSVVELISLWMAGPNGKGCSWVQKQQLSCLVRVQHLSPAYAQVRLPSLKWFHILGAQNDIVVLAASCRYGMAGVCAVPGDAPPAWSAAPRKPLDSAELLRRSTIRWGVPRQQLVDLLASKDLTTKVYSESFYIAGTGWRILMKLSKKKRKGAAAGFSLGVFSELVSYAQCGDHHIGEKMKAAPLQFALHRPASIPAGIAWTSCTMVTDWGWSDWLQTALVSPEDLEPFLEGGCLQVTACFRVPHNGKKLP